MATNLHAPNDNSSLGQYINGCVNAGTVAGFNYPDGAVCLYLKAAIAAGTADVPGAPRLEVAQMVRAALGA